MKTFQVIVSIKPEFCSHLPGQDEISFEEKYIATYLAECDTTAEALTIARSQFIQDSVPEDITSPKDILAAKISAMRDWNERCDKQVDDVEGVG